MKFNCTLSYLFLSSMSLLLAFKLILSLFIVNISWLICALISATLYKLLPGLFSYKIEASDLCLPLNIDYAELESFKDLANSGGFPKV